MSKKILNENFQKDRKHYNYGQGIYIYKNRKKYFDLSQSSGVLFLGHNHNNFKKSLKSIIKNKISISSKPNSYSEKLFKLIKFFFPNFHKIIYCTTGSESVIKALRIAKSINYKKKYLVSVTGSWHGSVDQTLFYPNKNNRPSPLSSGIDNVMKENIIFVQNQNIIQTKKILNKKKNNIYAVIIEPVMGSLPNEEMKNYLKFLVKYCKKNNITLIFDEIITGFRSENKSVQNNYNLSPDITLIGKVLGGGTPISAIGITKKISLKLKKYKIFFGGTFSANSISSYIAMRNLIFLKKNIPNIKKLNLKCKSFQEKINYTTKINNIDARVYRYSNIMRIVFSKKIVRNRVQRDFLENKKIMQKNKFIKYLYKNNIYYPSNGIIFLPLTTTYKEMKYLIKFISQGLKMFF